jgi:hypothetical protein
MARCNTSLRKATGAAAPVFLVMKELPAGRQGGGLEEDR